MSIWAVVFAVMSATQGVGDTHRARWVPFWQEACRDGRRNGCQNLALMDATYCKTGSGWACNDLGLLLAERKYGNPAAAGSAFRYACDFGFSAGCENLRVVSAGGGSLQNAPPRLVDYPIVLNEGKGPIPDRTPADLYRRACRQGWTSACRSLDGDAQ